MDYISIVRMRWLFVVEYKIAKDGKSYHGHGRLLWTHTTPQTPPNRNALLSGLLYH